jgi:hypothetical protein
MRISPKQKCDVVPMMIPTFPTPRPCDNNCPKLQKSILPLSEGGILTTLHKWECLPMLQKNQHSLLAREAFHPPSSPRGRYISHLRSTYVSRTRFITTTDLQSSSLDDSSIIVAKHAETNGSSMERTKLLESSFL